VERGKTMNKQDAALVTDERVLELADATGMSPEGVVEYAEKLADEDNAAAQSAGDPDTYTVSDELDSGVVQVEEQALGELFGDGTDFDEDSL